MDKSRSYYLSSNKHIPGPNVWQNYTNLALDWLSCREKNSFCNLTIFSCSDSFSSLRVLDPAVKLANRNDFSKMSTRSCSISFCVSRRVAVASNSVFAKSDYICCRAHTLTADWLPNYCTFHIGSACPPSLSSPTSGTISRCRGTDLLNRAPSPSATLFAWDLVINQAFLNLTGTYPTLQEIMTALAAHFWQKIEWGGTELIFPVEPL